MEDRVLTAAVLGVLFAVCAAPARAADPLPLAQVRYWGYQIQSIEEAGAVERLERSHYDMLVLEPTRTDWSSDNKYFDTKGMVTRLKASPATDGVHRKLVLAYVDIGEAEDWRWYWTWSTEWEPGEPRPADWPSFIVTHDPDGWSGNYPVAYWDARWKDIVIWGRRRGTAPVRNYTSVIDEVIKDGFDGIYLDWVEAFENEDVMQEAERQGRNAAGEMITFIDQMRRYGEKRVKGFLVIQQNAASLCEGHPELFSKIHALAQEAIWYDGDADTDWSDPDGYDRRNPKFLTNQYLGYLAQYLEASLPVFDCEYAVERAADAYKKSHERGFVPYCSRRALSRLTTTPPPARVRVTSPAAGSIFQAPATIEVTVEATDPEGIAKVDLYSGSRKLGTSLAEPYAFTWADVSGGRYNLKAQATDRTGAKTISPPVAIQVKDDRAEGFVRRME